MSDLNEKNTVYSEKDSIDQKSKENVFYMNKKREEEQIMSKEEMSIREFEQYEKRIEDQINNLEKEISRIPDKMEDKIKILLNEQLKEIQKERKDDRRTIITLSISGTSAIVAILGLLGKAFGWF